MTPMELDRANAELRYLLKQQRDTIEQQAEELEYLKERDEVAKWYETLVTRACIGTAKTPSMRAYIEQIEQENDKQTQEMARLREALTNLLEEKEHP